MNLQVISLFILLLLIPGVRVEGKSLAELKQLDLLTAQDIAVQQNPSLAAAAERVEQARQRIAQARALYYPSIDAGGSATSARLSEKDAQLQSRYTTGSDINRNSERYRISLNASWLLFDGFSRKFSTLIAEYGQQESEQARRDGMRLLLQSVAESYYRAQLSLSNKAIAEADFSFNQKQAGEAKISMDAGAGSLSAVLNFQVQMNNASTEILLAERDYDLALYGLAVLLGRSDGKMPEGLMLAPMDTAEMTDFEKLPTDELLQAAMRYRPDLLGRELSVERAQSGIGANRARLYPQLSLLGSVDGNRYDDTSFGGDDFGQSVLLNLSYNFFNGGGDMARIAEAKAFRRETVRNLEEQKNRVQSEVYQAITRLQQAQDQLILQQASVKLVEQTRDLVEEGYKAGQESLARFNEVQRDLVRTQSRLALSLIGLYTNREALKSATGQSLIPYLDGTDVAQGSQP